MGILNNRWAKTGLSLLLILFTSITLATLAANRKEKDDLQNYLERVSFDTLGYVKYEDGRFLTNPDNTQFKAYQLAILEHSPIQGVKVFIWDVNKQKVVWDMNHHSADGEKQEIPPLPVQQELAKQAPKVEKTAPNGIQHTVYSASESRKYLTTYTGLTLNKGNDKKEKYVFVAAAPISGFFEYRR